MDGSCQDRDENACCSERTHLSVYRMQQKKVTEDSELSFLFFVLHNRSIILPSFRIYIVINTFLLKNLLFISMLSFG